MGKKYLCILICFASFGIVAQVKFEKEYRAKTKEIPEESLKIIEQWDFKKKVKWYVEESQDGKTYEAKVCYKKNRLSIEFSEQGEIIDAEKTIKFADLEQQIQENIKHTLSEKFKKYRIKKIQIQFKGKANEIYHSIFQLKNNVSKIVPEYEITVKGKKDKKYQNVEILIDQNGKIVKELLIKPSNSINLEF